MNSEQPHWSPDGKELAATATNSAGAIVGSVMKANGRQRRVFDSPKGAPALACVNWSPDAQHLACEGFNDGSPSQNGVYIVSSKDGQDLRRVTHNTDVPCSYSPAGDRILFVRINPDNEDASTLMTVRTDGSQQHVVTRTPVSLGCDWSPDGSTLLAISDGKLLRVALNGAVTPFATTGRFSGAAFSPDGKHIVVSRGTGDHQADVWTMNADGTHLNRITFTTGANNDEQGADWGL